MADPQKAAVGDAIDKRNKLNEFLQACQSGDVKQLKKLASNLRDVDIADVKDNRGRSFLHHAAQAGHFKAVRYLIDDVGCKINQQDASGETALSFAAQGASLETVELLIENWADINLCAPGDVAPIHRAAASADAKVLEKIIALGSDVNKGSAHGPPLCWAAGHSNTAAVKLLLEKGSGAAGGGAGAIHVFEHVMSMQLLIAWWVRAWYAVNAGLCQASLKVID